MGQHQVSGDPKAPHVFQTVDLLPGSPPLPNVALGADQYVPPPTPPGKSQVCGVCRKPRGDRVHIAGEARADAESPHWG